MAHVNKKIDGVNYVQRTFPVHGVDATVEGITVRALINVLQNADPDDLVCYLVEQTTESRAADMILDGIAGVSMKNTLGVTYIFGPEAAKDIRLKRLIG